MYFSFISTVGNASRSNRLNGKVNLSVKLSSRIVDTLSYQVSGEERDVDFYAEKIEDIFNSTKQWYSFINNGTYKNMIITPIIINLLIEIVFLIIAFKDWKVLLFVYFITGMISLFVWDKIRGYLFPLSQLSPNICYS